MAVICGGEGCENFRRDVSHGDDPTTNRGICTNLGRLAAEMGVSIQACAMDEAPDSVIQEAARRSL